MDTFIRQFRTDKRAPTHESKVQQRMLKVARGWGEVNIPIPRDATSVATMTGDLPDLNWSRTQSRSFCCLSPWMAGAD